MHAYTSVCSIPKGAPEEVNPLTEDEQKKLFVAMKGEEHEYLFLTDIFTGMRCGELIGLTWDCIDFERGIITIWRQIVQIRERHAIYEWGTLKNGKNPYNRSCSLRDGRSEETKGKTAADDP